MSVKNRIQAIQLTTFNAAGLLAAYQVVNATGLDFPCSILRINNASNTAITISYDGVTDHEYLAANQVLQLEPQTNSQPSANVSLFAKGMFVYVKGTAGVGTIALSGYYNPQGV